MTPQTSDWQALTGRVEKLERQNRRLKQAGAVALIIAAAVLLMGQASTSRTVEANEFVLKDASGKVRAKLSIVGDLGGVNVAQLAFTDPQGNRLMTLRENRLAIESANGQAQINLNLIADNFSILNLIGPDGKHISIGVLSSAGGLGSMPDGPFLSLSANSAGLNARMEMEIDAGMPSLTVSDNEGFQTTVGTALLETTRTGETHKTSAASVVLFDKDKNVIWKAP